MPKVTSWEVMSETYCAWLCERGLMLPFLVLIVTSRPLVQHMLGGLDVTGISSDSEASSVVLDGDAEALLNLEEVLVSRPAEHGEPVDVLRLKDDFVSFCISQVTFPDGTPSLQSLRNRPS